MRNCCGWAVGVVGADGAAGILEGVEANGPGGAGGDVAGAYLRRQVRNDTGRSGRWCLRNQSLS